MTHTADSLSSARHTELTQALRNLTQALLDEAEVEDELILATDLVRTWANADAALVFLPTIGEQWACEITSGDDVAHFVGLPCPPQVSSYRMAAPTKGTAIPDILDSPFDKCADFSRFGPAALIPLVGQDRATIGAFVVLRTRGNAPFNGDDLEMIADYALQMSLVLKLAEVRDVGERALVLEERERISRDLHDYAIQEIFGAGIGLEHLRTQIEEHCGSCQSVLDEIDLCMRSLEQATLQIRRVVFSLHESPEEQRFSERLEDETSRARRILGFAPSLVFELDGIPVIPNALNTEVLLADLSSRVEESIALDAAATVREALSNVARHANARSVQINVAVSGKGIIGEIVVAIVDDGSGLEPGLGRNSGIDNMSRRASIHGGSFAIGAGPRGRGTSLIWRAPLKK